MAVPDFEWHGVDGSVWHVCGSRVEEENVLLLPNIADMFDTPISTQWVKSPFGEKYQGFRVQRRNPVLGFRIRGASTSEWERIDSDFRRSWDYDSEGFMRIISEDGYRDLHMRLLQHPDTYSGDAQLGGGYDPHWLSDAQIIINAACENPFYVGKTHTEDYTITSSSGSHDFTVWNDGDVEKWVRWTIISQNNGLLVVLPDYSFGNDMFGAAVTDASKTVPVCAMKSHVLSNGGLLANEHVRVDTHPDSELILSDLDTNPWARMKGKSLVYPVPPHTMPTTLTVSWSGATSGDQVRLAHTDQYTRPWGLSNGTS